MNIRNLEVPPDQLRTECDPSMFNFKCTKDLAPLREFIGQDRAIRGIEFGLSMKNSGYNIYVAGLSGTGKTSIVKAYVNKIVERRKAEGSYTPDDWCYLYNFNDEDKPQILNLPQGTAKAFKERITRLLERLKDDIAKAFSSEEYKSNTKNILQQGQNEQQKMLEDIGQIAKKSGFALQITAVGPVIIPLLDGKPMPEDAYTSLDDEARSKIEKNRTQLLEKLQTEFEQLHSSQNKTLEKLQSFDLTIAEYTVSKLFDDLLKDYKEMPNILTFLNELKNYTMDNLAVFKEKIAQTQTAGQNPVSPQTSMRNDPFLPFQVNVFVDNSETKGPPVIIELNPNFLNLFGKIERHFIMGGYFSDHTMIKPGALHIANGGYLLLNAMDVILNPAVWPTLKRIIKNKEVYIEEPYEQFGLFVPQGLRPQPMPIEVKIILIGDAYLYQMLAAYDEDFFEIFKVKADFDNEVVRNKENMLGFAAFISGCCEDCDLKHFDKAGVAAIIDYASRLVADQGKLSSRFSQIKELVEESEYWSRRDSAKFVMAKHVEKAIEEKRFRHSLPDEKIREMITDGTIMIDVDGSVTGQVNGLSVYSLGDISFGKPSRITCQTYLGRSGVINIEREAHMSGNTHDKGILILSGYLGWKFARDYPLSLSASLCFEQSYEGIDGDSASSTELYAILSSLSETPLKQGIAVTGSINQKGEIQPIGGINQKIEGFFEVCRAIGFTGEQGILMPEKNLKHLMLRKEVVEAVRNGQFHVWAIKSVDEGIEILTGVQAGQFQQDGTYPEGTINWKVDKKLREMGEKLKGYSATEKKDDSQGNSGCCKNC